MHISSFGCLYYKIESYISIYLSTIYLSIPPSPTPCVCLCLCVFLLILTNISYITSPLLIGPTWRSATPKDFRNWQPSWAKHYRAQRKSKYDDKGKAKIFCKTIKMKKKKPHFQLFPICMVGTILPSMASRSWGFILGQALPQMLSGYSYLILTTILESSYDYPPYGWGLETEQLK